MDVLVSRPKWGFIEIFSFRKIYLNLFSFNFLRYVLGFQPTNISSELTRFMCSLVDLVSLGLDRATV